MQVELWIGKVVYVVSTALISLVHQSLTVMHRRLGLGGCQAVATDAVVNYSLRHSTDTINTVGSQMPLQIDPVTPIFHIDYPLS